MKRDVSMIILGAAVLAACTQGADGNGEVATNEMPVNQTQSILRDEVREELGEDLVEEEGPMRLTVGFPDGGSELDEAALAALDRFMVRDVIDSDEPIRLTGHSDTVGSDEANFAAGEARARAIADFMIEKGVAEDRIMIITLGEGNPIEPNYLPDGSDNAAGQAANRRVDIMIGEMAEPDEPVDGSQPVT